ncbi:hypothetical protein [Salinithrix halophila]
MVIERKKRQKVKGVAFNLDEPADMELLDWAESRGKFSTYVKRLIDLDRRLNGGGWVGSSPKDEGGEEAATLEEKTETDEWDLSADDIDDDMLI